MSTEAVTKFLSRLAEDLALQEQARSLAKDAQDPAAAAVDLGSKQGFQFTAAEFDGGHPARAESPRRTAGRRRARAGGRRAPTGFSYRLSDAGAPFSRNYNSLHGSTKSSRTAVRR